jgi:hypothetical protein
MATAKMPKLASAYAPSLSSSGATYGPLRLPFASGPGVLSA